MKITTVGIDLAKNVFQVHGVNEHGKAALKKQLKRGQVAEFFANLPACLIGMEACGSAHHWARKLYMDPTPFASPTWCDGNWSARIYTACLLGVA
jgi:hypothetical protein